MEKLTIVFWPHECGNSDMVIRSLKPLAAKLLVIYDSVSSVTTATARAAHHSYLKNLLAQPFLAFLTSLMEIMTEMNVGIKRRLNDVTVPDYDNLILKLVWNLWVRLGKTHDECGNS